MPAADRLDLIAIVILQSVLSDRTKFMALAEEANKAKENSYDYIAKWVWAQAKRIEDLRP